MSDEPEPVVNTFLVGEDVPTPDEQSVQPLEDIVPVPPVEGQPVVPEGNLEALVEIPGLGTFVNATGVHYVPPEGG